MAGRSVNARCAVRRRIAITTRVEAALEEISEINLELLSRRKLD